LLTLMPETRPPQLPGGVVASDDAGLDAVPARLLHIP
jgi:hypothetical protein